MYPLIRLSDSLYIPTYLTLISLIYTLALFWVLKRAKDRGLSAAVALDSSFFLMVGGFLGARFFHVFYEAFPYYRDDPLRILWVWQGGFVFYGGALGGFLAALLYCHLKKIDSKLLADVYAPVVAVGYAFGRLACFLNGCCYGAYCDLPWAIEYPSGHPDGLRHPTQIYAFLWEMTLAGVLFYFEKIRYTKSWARWLKNNGQIFYFWVFFHGLGRIMMETFRDDFRGNPLWGLSISTWISIGLLLAGSHFLFHNRK